MDDGIALDINYSIGDIDRETLIRMIKDCEKFQNENKELLKKVYGGNERNYKYDQAAAGHDFWLTRNRHGIGFWDSGLGKIGMDLTASSVGYGEVELYVGNDNKIYSI